MKLDNFRFGVSYAVDHYRIEQDKSGKILDYMREKYGAELGIAIANKKKWHTDKDRDYLFGQLEVIVFTPEELQQYVKYIRGH